MEASELGHLGVYTIPNTSMMGATVAENCNTSHPTFKHFMLRKIERACHYLLGTNVFEIIVKLGERFNSLSNEVIFSKNWCPSTARAVS